MALQSLFWVRKAQHDLSATLGAPPSPSPTVAADAIHRLIPPSAIDTQRATALLALAGAKACSGSLAGPIRFGGNGGGAPSRLESHPLGWLSKAADAVAHATRHASIASTAVAAAAERWLRTPGGSPAADAGRDAERDGMGNSAQEAVRTAVREAAAAVQQRASAMETLCEPAWLALAQELVDHAQCIGQVDANCKGALGNDSEGEQKPLVGRNAFDP